MLEIGRVSSPSRQGEEGGGVADSETLCKKCPWHLHRKCLTGVRHFETEAERCRRHRHRKCLTEVSRWVAAAPRCGPAGSTGRDRSCRRFRQLPRIKCPRLRPARGARRTSY